jgi:hypothetical protein
MSREAMFRVTGRVETRLDRPGMTGGGAAIKARGCPPNLLRKSVPPTSAARRSAARSGPDNRSATRLFDAVLDGEDASVGGHDGHGSEHRNGVGSRDGGVDRGPGNRVGRGAGAALAHRFIEAEDVDFHWDARVEERWLGAYESIDDDGLPLDRIAICGRLDGRWFVSVMLVDGDATPHGMLGCRFCRSRKAAYAELDRAH